jgi:hypothetical protein
MSETEPQARIGAGDLIELKNYCARHLARAIITVEPTGHVYISLESAEQVGRAIDLDQRRHKHGWLANTFT